MDIDDKNINSATNISENQQKKVNEKKQFKMGFTPYYYYEWCPKGGSAFPTDGQQFWPVSQCSNPLDEDNNKIEGN